MTGMEEIKKVTEKVVKLLGPELVILYGTKINVSEKLKGFDLCVVAQTENKTEAEKKVYLEVEAEMPFNVLIYTPDEWNKQLEEELSFAEHINRKGTVVYDKRRA